MSTETLPAADAKPADAHTPEAVACKLLAALALADADVRGHPEPRMGETFDAKNRAWRSAYARAIAHGTQLGAAKP